MAATSIAEARRAVLVGLVDWLAADHRLMGAYIGLGPPVTTDTNVTEWVIVGDVKGINTRVPSMKAGRVERRDEFEIELVVEAEVQGDQDGRLALEAAARLFNTVDDVLADDPTLGSIPGLAWVVVGNPTNGPDRIPTEGGWAAGMAGTLYAVTNLE